MTLEEKFLGIYEEIKEEISQPVMKIALKEEKATIFDSKVGEFLIYQVKNYGL